MTYLHDELREHARICEQSMMPMTYTIDGVESSLPKLITNLSARIEREYIPLPRFVDGEPVEIGGYVKGLDGGVCTIETRVTKDGIHYFLFDDEGCVSGDGPFRRPEPKVLDADGVEIKVGDTVWHISGSDPWTVASVDSRGVLVNDGMPSTDECGYMLGGYDLTHREPDRLEKLLERMESYAQKNEGYVDGSKVGNFAKELRAIIERGA